MKNIVLTVVVLMCIVFVSWGVFELWENRDGSCVMARHTNELVFGDIQRVPAMYRLYYLGTYEHSGRKCLYPVRVTKAEYERQMYKVKR